MPWDKNRDPARNGYGAAWKKLRREALLRDRYLCVACRKRGVMTKATDVDHVVEKSKGGADALDNLQSLCGPCHRTKTATGEARPQRRINLDGTSDDWV